MEEAKVFNEKSFSQQLRPAWTPLNVAIMIFFFVTGLWILGLAMIAYMIYGQQMGLNFANWGAYGKGGRCGSRRWRHESRTTAAPTGNAAFDEWRQAEIDKLEEERRKLDEARRDFEAYLEELKQAKDREEFEAFKARWSANHGSDEQGPAPAAS